MKKTGIKKGTGFASRDISQLLTLSGVPNDKMSFVFRTRYGDVEVRHGYIVKGDSKAIGHLMFTLKKPNVKLNMPEIEKQQKGFINSMKGLFKKK
jgi:hypothetical protein